MEKQHFTLAGIRIREEKEKAKRASVENRPRRIMQTNNYSIGKAIFDIKIYP